MKFCSICDVFKPCDHDRPPKKRKSEAEQKLDRVIELLTTIVNLSADSPQAVIAKQALLEMIPPKEDQGK